MAWNHEAGTAADFIDLIRRIVAFTTRTNATGGAGWEMFAPGDPFYNSEGIRSTNAWGVCDPLSSTYHSFSTSAAWTFEFFDPKEIGRLIVTMPDIGSPTVVASPETIELDVSSDGVNWTLAGSWPAGPVWDAYESRSFSLSTATTTRHVRFRVPDSQSGSACYIYKLRFLDGGGTEHFLWNGTDVSTSTFVRSPFEASAGIAPHVRIITKLRDAEQYYGLGVSGSSTVVGGTVAETGQRYFTRDYESPDCYSHYWDTAMPYWFYGDERSVVGFVRVSNTYRQFGFGYLNAYATPQQWPLSFWVGGEYSGWNTKWDLDTGGNVKGFTDPGSGAFRLFHPDQIWNEHRNWYTSAGSDSAAGWAREMWPGCSVHFRYLTNAPGTNDTNGNYGLFPICPINADQGYGVYGELPNLFQVPSLNLASEDIITVSGGTYRVFQNVWRTSRHDFCAVRET